MTTYVAPSGATVFATGSMQWSWGLDDFGAPTLRDARSNAAAQQITRNVLDVFGATPAELAPFSQDDRYAVLSNGSIAVQAPGVLENDIDASLLTAVWIAGPLHGTLVQNSDGSFVYSPDAGFEGPDVFAYAASDGMTTG